MGKRTMRVIAVIGAAAVLVVGVDAVSYAANGKSLLLGKSNKASKVTEVKRTKAGPALKLTTKKATDAPFATNAKGKVVNLNADSLDGLDSTALLAKSSAAQSKADAALAAANDVNVTQFKDSTGTRAGNTTYTIGKMPAGTYLTSFNASVVLGTVGTNSTPQTMSCYLGESFGLLNSRVYAQNASVSVGYGYASPSFTNVLTLTGNENLKLTCGTSAGDGWNTGIFSIGFPPTLSFTKIDGATNKTMAP